MSDHEMLAHANKVIADYEAGAYDKQLGIDPETRSLLTRATGGEALSLADVHALTVANRPDLIDAAHRAGRIILNEREDNS